eukprot:Em0016g302a
MSSARSSSSRTATPSEIGEVRGAYLSSLRAAKPPENVDWSKLLENPGGVTTNPNPTFKKSHTEPSIQADTDDRFLKRGPIVKTSQLHQVRPEDRPSDASRLHKAQLPIQQLLASMDSDSSLEEHYDSRDSRERQELSATATDRPPVVRSLQEAFEREVDARSVEISVYSVDSSTDPAARVLANIHTIEELEADLLLEAGEESSDDEDSDNVGRKGSGHQGRLLGSGDVSSVAGYSVEEDFESASEVKTQIEETSINTECTKDTDEQEITVEGEEITVEGEVAHTDTSGTEVTRSEEVVTEAEGGASQQDGSDDGHSTGTDTERSDRTVMESGVVMRPSHHADHSSGKGTRSAIPDGLGTHLPTPGGLDTRTDGPNSPSMLQASSPRISRSTRHTGVQTDEAARSWTRAHSCFPGDQGYTPIVPFVVGADALKAMTMHAPSEVALSNVIRAQLSLTRSLISSSRQMAESTLRSLNTNYRYTTLKETKEYIAKCKPRVLTVEEAKRKLNKRH